MPNNSIGCNVSECKYHAKNINQCTLDHIEVIKHKSPAVTTENTDCGSFEKE